MIYIQFFLDVSSSLRRQCMLKQLNGLRNSVNFHTLEKSCCCHFVLFVSAEGKCSCSNLRVHPSLHGLLKDSPGSKWPSKDRHKRPLLLSTTERRTEESRTDQDQKPKQGYHSW